MKVTEYIPTEQLTPFVKSYRIIESSGDVINRVLPGTSLAIAFRFKGQISYINNTAKIALPAATLSGLRKSVRLINYAPETAALVVLFKESGISAFIKHPVHELFEKSVSLECFFPKSEISTIEERLAEAGDHETRVSLMDQFLCSKLLDSKPDRIVTEAISRIYLSKGMIRMTDLAGSLFISQDALEKRFRKATGTTPKQFSFIVRVGTITRQSPASSSFLDMALDFGYYDQPHFNKDFRIFTGLTPTEFFKSASYW
ncbi:MAG TPA: helix-turn-helix domain-containing protein [Chitinophagaceae bacterium]